MKKLTALLLALTLLLLASACGGGPGTDSPDANKPAQTQERSEERRVGKECRL